MLNNTNKEYMPIIPNNKKTYIQNMTTLSQYGARPMDPTYTHPPIRLAQMELSGVAKYII